MHYRNIRTTKITLKVILIAIFLFLSYNYYSKNRVDAFFTMLIQLPFVYKVVESWIYWVIVLVICFGIWKLIDLIRFR